MASDTSRRASHSPSPRVNRGLDERARPFVTTPHRDAVPPDRPPTAAERLISQVLAGGRNVLPVCSEQTVTHVTGIDRVSVARPEGLEPSTPGLEGRCSIQLSYGRVSCMLLEARDLVHALGRLSCMATTTSTVRASLSHHFNQHPIETIGQ